MIGFRTLNLITVNDTDSSVVNQSLSLEGSGNHGMFFRINGAAVWARGANVVPMDQLEGRLTDQAHRVLVQSAADAGLNMLRVWGGGMVLPESFYDACDELGILVYQDMMLVEQDNHGAKETPVLKRELQHLVRTLSSHPSIVLWSGCNECIVQMDTDMSIYATFVMQTVAEEDPSRPLWPSCPSTTGWKTGVNRIDGKPNGRALATYARHEAKPPNIIEKHGPYRHGTSATFPTMNSKDDEG
jgi:beta-galactosidase/beta-glucuronidase